MKIFSNLSGTTGNFSGVSTTTNTVNAQVHTSKLVTATNTSGAHQFIDDTGIDSAGRYVAMFEKKWTGGGSPDGNNSGIVSYVLPNTSLTRIAAIQFRWGMSPAAGNETSSFNLVGYYTGSSITLMNISGVVQIGQAAQAIGTGDIAIGVEPKTWNASQIAIGLRAGKTIGSATGKQGSISIGNNANSGSYPIGSNSIAFGVSSIAKSGDTISIGRNAGNTTNTGGDGAVSIGFGANAGTYTIGSNSIAIGVNAKSKSTTTIAIGSNAANTTGTIGVDTISIGTSSNSGTGSAGSSSIAIGLGAVSGGVSSISMGNGATNAADNTVSIGLNGRAKGTSVISIGNNAGNTSGSHGTEAISIGSNANQGTDTVGQGSIAIGATSKSSNTDAIAIGNTAIASGNTSIAIGPLAKSFSQWGISFGRLAWAKNTDVISIGVQAGNTSGTVGAQAISIGRDSNFGTGNIGASSIAIGYGAISSGTSAIALGQTALASLTNTIAIGTNSRATGGTNTIAIGNASKVTGLGGISIGNLTQTQTGVALGHTAISMDGIAIGASANASVSNQVAIGSTANAGSTGGVAIGHAARSANTSVAIGFLANNSGLPSNQSVTIGATANQSVNAGLDAIGIGYGIHSTGNRSIAIGSRARASGGTNIYVIGSASASTVNTTTNSLQISWGVPNEDLKFIKGKLLTTGATTGDLLTFTLPTLSVYSVKATIKARKTDGTDRALYVVEAFAYREGGGAVLEGGLPYDYKVVESSGATSWNGDIDVSGNDLRVCVTGAAATTILWHVILEIQKVG